MDLREAQRLAALKSYKVLDTPADAAIDRLANLAGNLFDTPISLVSLVDEERQWFKARVGLDAPSTPRGQAFCAHAIAMGPESVMVVEDATQDPRFADNPLVTGAPDIRFYAGATLTTKDGHNLGTLCVIDDKPRPRPAQSELERLKLLARIVVDEFELTKAQRETAEKQRLLELAESVAAIGHWRIDVATNHLSWSDQTFKIFGFTRENYVPTVEGSLAHYSAADRAALEQGIDRAVAQKGGFDLRVQLIRASGEIRDVMARGLCELDDHGEVSALFGLLQDVTDYSNAMRSVEATSDRYRLLTENANDLVTRMGLDGRFTYVSPAVRTISGYAPEEVVGRAAMGFIHPDDRARVAEIFETALYGPSGWTIEYRIVRKDGAVRWVEARPRLTHDPVTGAPAAVTDVIRDITDRKAADDALADSEARYRLMADNASDMISRLDAKGVIVFMSPASKAMLGYRPEELLGKRVIDLTHPDDIPGVMAYFRELIAAGPGASAESLQYRGRRRDGEWVWLEGQPTVFFDPVTGALSGIQDVIRDITSRKAMEAALEAARAEAEDAANVKAEFLSNMSHELRTPLTAVLGFSRLIAEQPELTEGTRRYVERVSSAGKALLSTVNDILDFSKLEAGQVEIVAEPCAPAALITEALDLFSLQAGEKGLELRGLGLDLLPASLTLPPDRVRQILLNLVGNAVKFTEQGMVSIEAVYARGWLRLAVRDTGTGIPAERLDALFKRFSQVDGSSTRRHGGTGLGLAICKGLVEAMGGKIGVESVEGQGSCFWFEIPAPSASAAPQAAAVEPTGFASGCRVLVVDDNPANRDLVSAVLSGLSVDLSEAEDGLAAVAIAQTRRFDLILMDQRMPVMDGETATRRIREGDGPNRRTPIIAFSANGAAQIDESLFDGLLAKPIDPGALLRGVASIMIGGSIAAAA